MDFAIWFLDKLINLHVNLIDEHFFQEKNSATGKDWVSQLWTRKKPSCNGWFSLFLQGGKRLYTSVAGDDVIEIMTRNWEKLVCSTGFFPSSHFYWRFFLHWDYAWCFLTIVFFQIGNGSLTKIWGSWFFWRYFGENAILTRWFQTLFVFSPTLGRWFSVDLPPKKNQKWVASTLKMVGSKIPKKKIRSPLGSKKPVGKGCSGIHN